MSYDRSRAKHRSLEEWRSIIADWKQNGLSQSEYCERNEISKSAFYKYHRRFKSDSLILENETQKVRFVEAKLRAPVTDVEYISIRCSVLKYLFSMEFKKL